MEEKSSLCRFVNGTHLLAQKYNYPGISLDTMLEVRRNKDAPLS